MGKRLIQCLCGLMLLLSVHVYAATNAITAARVWPAEEYTRITFEAIGPVKHQLITLKNPDRLVLDIEEIELNTILTTLSDRILSSDPYIKQVRVAKFKANVVRIAIDLKTEVNPNVFALTPAGDYKYRLVVDINPIKDPITAMLEKRDSTVDSNNPQIKPVIEPLPKSAQTDEPNSNDLPSLPEANTGADGSSNQTKESAPNNLPETDIPKSDEAKKSQDNKKPSRTITIAIDAGHGGEDPGARGANGSREKDITLAIAKKLKEKIDNEPNMSGILTRDGDYFIPLHGRVVKARKLKADLFISIHADSFTNPAARGSSVFALSEEVLPVLGRAIWRKKKMNLI